MNFDFDPGDAITNAYGERFFPSINGNLFEKSSAATVFGRYFKETFNRKDTLYIIGGSDSGLLPFYLADFYKTGRGGRKFIFLDFKAVFKEIDISGLPSWIECYPADFSMGLLSQTEVEYMASGRMALIKSLAMIDAKYQDVYGQFLAYLEGEYRKLMFAENVTSVTRSFVDAQLMNIHRNIKPIKLLRGKLKQRDVLMIGGGPSLDDSIDWIKANADKFIIFAAARTAPRMLKEGIKPDFLVSVDPHDLSFDNSKRMLEFEQDTILMNCHHINPKLLNQWALNSVYFGGSLPWGESEENSSSPGPTVIHSALHQAVFMGASNVYLTGVDLCFYNGQTHASGSAESEIGKLGVKHLTQVETYAGEMAETDQAFSSGVDSLAWLVKGYKTHSPDCSIYNLSQNAARVDGVEFKDKSTVPVDGLSSKHGLMDEMNDILTVDLKTMQSHQKKHLTLFQKKRLLLKEAIKLAEQGLKLTAKYSETTPDSNKLVKVKIKLDKKLGELGEMLYHYGIDYFRDVFRPVEDETQMTQDEISSTLEGYFKGMKASCTDFIARLDKSMIVLKNRIEEYRETSRPADLLPAWMNQFEIGRYRIWMHYHPNVELTTEDQAALDQAAQILQKNILHTNTKQAQLLKDRSLSPVELHGKAMGAFTKQDLDALKDIQTQLKKVPGYEGQQLACLVKGMIADLQEESEVAIEAYAAISFKPFKLLALKRQLHYAMLADQQDQVLIHFEHLCEFSIEYMLPYADYLTLLGQNEFAFAVMHAFIQKSPEHFSGLLKLAELALKVGKAAEALDALKQAEALQPNNPQVKQMIQLLTSN
ncbi:MAG: motility associated factor glycosyltransferase family protein [Thiotrichales bacterium]|nr:motility associated factor glycosyltransferase family protein [Thiotrichales bacterium]